MILTTDAQVRISGVNAQKLFTFLYSWELSHDKSRLWTQKIKDCFSDIWTYFSRFFIFIMMNFIFVWRDFIYFSTQ